MDVLQSWLVVGVPGLVAVGVLFVGYSRTRALIGYAVLAALIAFFLVVPADPISASVLGFLFVVFIAAGRGTANDDRRAEHHQGRERLTTASPAQRD